MFLIVLLAFTLGAFLSWAIILFFMSFLRVYMLDRPNLRSSHTVPIPSGAGISFVIVTSISSVISLSAGSDSISDFSRIEFIPLLAMPIAFVGFLDDRISLSATCRFSIHFITALAIIYWSPLGVLSIANLPLLLLMIVGSTAVINFTNFMDGLDGLVAGCMFVAISTVSIQLSVPWPIWALAGSLLGFLFWNWSPAKVFMGDVGSTFLGVVFVGLVLHANSWTEALGLIFIAFPLIGDACLCVLRRLFSGQRVFQAHRLHLFQRLHQAGWTHSDVSILYIVSTAVLSIAMLLGGLLWVVFFAGLEFLIGIWLDQRVAVPFAEALRS